MSYASAAGPGGRMRRALLWIIFPLLAAQSPAFAAKPVILSSVPDLTIFEGDQVQIIIKAYDPDGDSIYYVLDRAPSGTVLTDSIITWTSTFLHVGRDTIIYSVRDYPWHTATWDTVTITVLDVGLAGTYTDVSSQRGLDDPGMTNALAWADYNGDGVADLFVANAGETGTLYLGDSSGSFTPQNILPYVVGDAGSAAWDDYDHDGRPDLYVVHSGLFGGRVNTLYHNDTSGTFADTTQVSGTGNDGLGKSVSWVDFDCDGDPDIYVVNYGGANELYSNNGNGTFTAMADTAGIADAGNGVAAAWCDYNLDDYPDFYLVNERGDNRLFRNEGDSTFTDVTTTAGVGHTGNGSTAAWGDYDNDEDFDLFLGNKDSLQVLFSNNGDGTFTRLASSSGVAVRGSARSSLWIDFNMDGWLDLIVAFSDSTNKFFQNLGDSTFINAAPVIGIQELGYWSSVTWADPRNSGVPDICFGRRDGPNRYYQGSQQGNYLKVALHGLISSRFGVGSRVRVRAGDMVLNRWIDGGSGSMSEPVAHFGLGSALTVDSLSVFWPTGLRRDTVNLQINQYLVWHETDSIFPVIDSTTAYPHTTSLTGPYTIDTKVTDNDAVAVTLFYSSDRFTPYYTPVAMTDLGSGYFQGDIPGQASGTRIYYYIRAQDTPGHKTYDPFRAKDSLFSFSVDDSVPTVDSITVLDDTGDEAGPYPVAVRAVDNDTLEAVYLVWSISREGALVELDSVRMALTSADSSGFHFAAELAGRQIGTQVNYYARAVDLAGNYKHLPATAPDSTYSFRVSRFTERAFTTFNIERQGTGLSVSDYNLDQVQDVYLANLDTTDYLFQGRADSTFLNVSAATLGTTIRQSTGGVWGDYNNDRYPDLYIFGLGANVLLSNDRDGTFTDISASAGVADAGQTWGAAWVDYDNDGLLDLFTVNKDGSDRLYHNQGDSTLVDRAAQAGLAGQPDGVGCCWGDFDGDGDQDVFVVYYGKDNRLYRNNSGHTFTAVGGVLGAENSVSAAWQDYNNDSHLDLYVVGQNRDNLYRSNGNGTFSAVDMQAAGLGGSQGGFGITWGDFDNDGNPDFYKTRGESGQPDINVLYRGLGDGTFEDYTYESGSTDPGEYRGAAWLDYDLDGRQDLLLNNRSGKLRLYRNIGTWENNHYLRVRLVGTRSNIDGIGARVEVVYGGKTRRKDLGTGTGYTAQCEPVLHFGLGTSSSVDTLVVRWPNGIVQTLSGLAVDREITVTERDTLYPSITRHDTIPDQYQVVQPPGLTCSVLNRDSLTLVRVRYRASGVDSFTTRSMVRDSVSAAGTAFIGHYHYTMPALPAGSVNSWRIVASGLRGSTDSTELFQYSVNIDSVGPQVVFIERPDSILPDTTGPYAFRIRLTDNTGVAGASFVLSGRSYRGDSIGLRRDTVLSPPPDSLDWLVSVPGYGLGSRLGYYALAGDILGSADSTAVDSIIITPRKGKAGLGDGTTDVGDLLRLVYLVLGLVEQPGLIDTLGLDLDRNGYFSTVDLLGLLDIWHQGAHSSAMLASAGRVDGPLAAGLFEGKEGERVFQVENSVYLPYGIVELEADPPAAAAALRLVPGNRLAGLPYLCQNSAESGSILLVFASPGGGKGLAPGGGGLFTVDNSEAAPHQISVKRVHLGGREVTAGRDLGLARKVELPKSFRLDQNVPNPFNPSTTIRFALPVAQVPGGVHQVRLTVYNLRGQTVDNLLEGGLEPGYYNVVWNGTDRHGKPLPSGIYFYRLQVDERVFTRKMVLIK